jgi:hypothetical protein
MHFVCVHFRTERGIHPLMSLNGTFSLELGRYDGRAPMAAVALQFEVLTGQVGGNKRAQFFSSHIEKGGLSPTDFVANAQQVHRNGTDQQPGRADNAQTEPGRNIAHTEKAIAKPVNHVEKRVEVTHGLPKRRQ